MQDAAASSEDLEWEEWDGTSPFWIHCVAGSTAGVAEHTLVYPFDTVKTHLQACADCPHPSLTNNASRTASLPSSPRTTTPSAAGMWTTMRHIVSQAAPVAAAETASAETPFANGAVGVQRLWRGVASIIVGCIPAHALYFSTYEAVKRSFLDEHDNLSAVHGMMAGGAAAIGHDVVMTPLDTIKQRLQLGHYRGMMDALFHITKKEGYASLFRSFPITLFTNIPYGAVMVSTNELMKQHFIQNGGKLDVTTCIMSSSMAGMVAAATTTPLDQIKTRLQTQSLQPACPLTAGTCPKLPVSTPVTITSAFTDIVAREGIRGLFRGLVPRVISHTPAVAISWTTYETAKQYLTQQHYLNNP